MSDTAGTSVMQRGKMVVQKEQLLVRLYNHTADAGRKDGGARVAIRAVRMEGGDLH